MSSASSSPSSSMLTLALLCSIPGSFSRQKEKKGKQGKPRKNGKLRNTCASASLSTLLVAARSCS